MAEPASHPSFSGFARLKLFWALSRTPHGLLDMCTPAFAALLWLGALPPLDVILIGFLTLFAGYTAVYALNDVVDYRVDREKAAAGVLSEGTSDIDGVIVRHPMARGLLSFTEGLAWTVAWSTVALFGAYYLNPVCVVIFLGGCAFEAVYCKLWRVSPYRALVSGAVKTCGPIAAVFAVDSQPSALFLVVLFCTLFLWEIGGQNIPNELTDLEEDRRMGARTLPVRWGIESAIRIAFAALTAAVLISVGVFLISRLHHRGFSALIALGLGSWLLIRPGLRLFRNQDGASAMALFNQASYYPPALLAIVLLGLMAA